MEWPYIIGYLLGLKDGGLSSLKLNELGKDLRGLVATYPEAYDWPEPPENWQDTEFSALDFWSGYKAATLLGDVLNLEKVFAPKVGSSTKRENF